MAKHHGPKNTTTGLIFCVDAANSNSYPGSGSSWIDLMGNHGELAMTGNTYDMSSGGSILFDGAIGSFASTTNTFTQYAEMTWDTWFNRTSAINTFNMVFSSTGLPYLGFRDASTLGVENKFIFSWWAGAQRSISSPTPGTDNTWYNVTCTLKRDTLATTSTAAMYVNGVLVVTSTTAPGTVDVISQNGVMKLANYSFQAYPFNGKISMLKVYNRILTEKEIMRNYESHKSRFF